MGDHAGILGAVVFIPFLFHFALFSSFIVLLTEGVSRFERKVVLRLVPCFVTPWEIWIQHDLGVRLACFEEKESR